MPADPRKGDAFGVPYPDSPTLKSRIRPGELKLIISKVKPKLKKKKKNENINLQFLDDELYSFYSSVHRLKGEIKSRFNHFSQ